MKIGPLVELWKNGVGKGFKDVKLYADSIDRWAKYNFIFIDVIYKNKLKIKLSYNKCPFKDYIFWPADAHVQRVYYYADLPSNFSILNIWQGVF